MTQRIRLWIVVAALFTLGNAVSAGFAAALGESLHAAAHLALMIGGTYAVWRLAARAGRNVSAALPPTEQRLELLQASVDVVAIELERLGEAQRFNAKQQAGRVDPPA